MIVKFKELGFIKSIDIDLNKDLIVLCGPNNTGKTYAAYSIYGLMKYRSGYPKSPELHKKIGMLIENGQISIDLFDLLFENHNKLITQFCENYLKELPKIFAADDSTFSKTKFEIDLVDIDGLKDLILKRAIRRKIGIRNSLSFDLEKEKDSLLLNCLVIENEHNQPSSISEFPNGLLQEFIFERIYDIVLDILFHRTYIAPAERIAINIFSKELSLKRNILVDRLLDLKNTSDQGDPFDLINRRATRYPQPIRDSLEIAEDLNNFKKRVTEYFHFADEIERKILKGQIIISKDGDVQFKPDKAKSLKLPIHMTASVVKSLTNLVIYFRHLAMPGDFIIIDEPELNLHPDNQVIIAQIIAKIVNKGFKVLISTHSDYIIRELNNLIMLHSKSRFAKRLEYEEDVILDPERVSALLFNYNTRKAEKININKGGIEVVTIDEVINSLNERSQSLFFDLSEAEEQ